MGLQCDFPQDTLGFCGQVKEYILNCLITNSSRKCSSEVCGELWEGSEQWNSLVVSLIKAVLLSADIQEATLVHNKLFPLCGFFLWCSICILKWDIPWLTFSQVFRLSVPKWVCICHTCYNNSAFCLVEERFAFAAKEGLLPSSHGSVGMSSTGRGPFRQ